MEPWDQQPNEPNEWYYRFRLFVMLGPSRSINKAYLDWAGELGEEVPDDLQGPPAQWRKEARQYNWESRAAAFDKYQLDKRMEALEARRVAERERRWETLDHLYEQVNSMAAIPENAIDLKRLADSIVAYMEQSRLETGDSVPAKRRGAAEPGGSDDGNPAEGDRLIAMLDKELEGQDLEDVAGYDGE